MLSDPDYLCAPGPQYLDPAYYGSAAQPVQAGGRQAAWFVSGEMGEAVLRGYRRGGLIARLSRDRYVWLGEARTRSFAEYRLLRSLADQGLPVPAPLAAAYWRSGATYRAAILLARLPGVRPLAELLDQPVWQAVADVIARMHRLGVWHADLNAYNILLDAHGKAWLIDFDRGHQGGLSARARAANLARLRRSLQKVGGAAGESFYQRLEPAYRACMAARRG